MPTKSPADSAQIQKKAAVIADIKARLESADAAVLTEYRGLTVTDLADLRAALRPGGCDYKVFKNTLARRAATDAGLETLVENLEGPVAIAFVRKDGGDAVTAAKALREFAKGNPNLVVKGGVLGERVLSVKDVDALADVPPREVILARLAGGFQAPLTKAAGLFQAFTRNFAYGLKAYIDQRPTEEASEEAAEAPAEVASDQSDVAAAEAGPEPETAATEAPTESPAAEDAATETE